MSLRTYPLIVHPAFLSFVEKQLGRDEGLNELPATLTPPHIPSLKSIFEVADYLQVSPFLLRSMLLRKDKHYRQFSFNKRNGGKRYIDSPRTFLKVVQWWILDTILYNCAVPNCVHGFFPGKSFLTNARTHFGASHVLNMDVKDFFPSLKEPLVKQVFQSLGYSGIVSTDLAALTTKGGSLPQGAPTSPMIANLIMEQFDNQVSGFAKERGLTYTRYADDLTFSSANRIPAEVPDAISDYLSNLGLSLNGAKSRFMGPNDRKEVTGLILGLNDVRLSPEFLNRARGWFHTAACRPQNHAHQENHIRGTVALIEHVRGAGSAKVAELGRKALHALAALSVTQ